MPGRALWAPGHRAFLFPLSSDCRKRPSFPHDLPWAPVGRLKLLLVRDGGGPGPGERQTVKDSLGKQTHTHTHTHTHTPPHQWTHTDTHTRHGPGARHSQGQLGARSCFPISGDTHTHRHTHTPSVHADTHTHTHTASVDTHTDTHTPHQWTHTHTHTPVSLSCLADAETLSRRGK